MRLVIFGQARSWDSTLKQLQKYNAADSIIGLSDIESGESDGCL